MTIVLVISVGSLYSVYQNLHMKSFKTFIVVMFYLPMLCVGQSKDEAAVRKVFEEYKTAILNDKAETALQTIDKQTRAYYTDVLEKVRSADSAMVAVSPLVDRLTVLGIRARATKDEILAMKGTDAFLFAIKNGMVGKNSVSGNTLGLVNIDQGFAKGEMLVNGKKTPLYFHFYKEADGWKLNLTDLFGISNMALKQMLKDDDKSENDRLIEILSALTGRTIGSEIWQPIR
jgi:hypothetical protein